MKPNMILLAIACIALWLIFAGNKEPANTMEQQLAAVLGQVEHVGQVDVFIYRQKEEGLLFEVAQQGEVGVLIVAEGASSKQTKRLITETVSAVLNIPPHQI
ncbi:MAG: hypothetical protein ABS882_08450, partial [Lysinibacillus sp.]